MKPEPRSHAAAADRSDRQSEPEAPARAWLTHESAVRFRAPNPRWRFGLGLTLLGLAVFVFSGYAPPARAQTPDALAQQQQAAFRQALAALRPAIVKIETIGGAQPVRQEGEDEQRVATGFRQADGPTTGVIWSADGLILTSSFNFVREPSIITVTLADQRRFVGTLLARDHPSRLALLKIAATGLPTATWLRMEQARPGQWALAAGFGFGTAEPAISVGIVSGLNRMSGQAIQTDCKLSPANYGGPLFDSEGRVLGICVPMGASGDELADVEWYDSGIGFAIHFEHVKRRVERLAKGEDLERGLLGIVLDQRDPVVGDTDAAAASQPASQPVGPVEWLKLPRVPDGLRIIQPSRGPAADAGLAAGDVILRIDDTATVRVLDFRRAIAKKAAGDEVEVSYRRGADTSSVRIRLAAPSEFRAEPESAPGSQPSSAPAGSDSSRARAVFNPVAVVTW